MTQLIWSFRQPVNTRLALQYISKWLEQPFDSLKSPPILLGLCAVLKKVLLEDNLRDTLQEGGLNIIDVCAVLHAQIIRKAGFIESFRQGSVDETISGDDTIIHIPTAIRVLNDFVEVCEVSP